MNPCETCIKEKCFHRSQYVTDCSRHQAKPMTNADLFRAMSDEEQQKCVRRFWEIEDFADWLQQPVGGNEP